MNKIDTDIKKEITTFKYEEKELHLFDKKDQEVIYNVEDNATLKVYQYGININNDIIINLNGNNAKVEYHYSTINYENHKYNILVNHNASNTSSNIYNHGINVFDKKLDFNVTGKVFKNSDNCICNQENQILNLVDGDSTILPNLLIDNYNVSSSHSAYIGKFKDEILFYLMSRGLSRTISYDLLIKSFLINGSSRNEDIESLEKEIKNINEGD